ncbi:hypothetical protein LOK49_LG03G02860 [Camellia lanceoleosa]|uniref:Uncharacterized protein n=1 Tax=Camellia lanceoleosa TaxID=1840588 RepID=A0ACC0IEM6_9ERIC|nr:hypothetical protein LOK49_LG03G02860 [Camellia lanceoleosa]
MELERGKVLMETNFKNSINGFCKLKVGQFLYEIRVSEMEFQKIHMLGSSYYPKATVKVDEGMDESNSVEGFLSAETGDVQGAKDDGDHINVGEDVSVRSGNVLQGAVLAGDIEGLAPGENYGDDDVALLSQVEDSFDVTRSINGIDLRMLEAEFPNVHQRTESNALASSSSHPMLSQNQVRKSLSPNHASYPNHLNRTQALIFSQKISPIRVHKSTDRRKKLSLLKLGLPHKFLNKGRYAKGSNKKSKDAKLVRSSQPSQSSIYSSTIRVCNKRFLNKLVEFDEEMEQQDEDEEEEFKLLLAEAAETLQMGQKLQIDFGGREDIFPKNFIEMEMSNKAKIRKKKLSWRERERVFNL